MSTTKFVLYYLSGILIQQLSDLTIQSSEEKCEHLINGLILNELNLLAVQLHLGKIDVDEYCLAASVILPNDTSSDFLKANIPHKAIVNQAVVELIIQIDQDVENWLLLDLPDTWFRQIPGRQRILDTFPEDKIISTSSLGLEKFVPDLYLEFIDRTGCEQDQFMIVDSNQKRAVDSVRSQYSSTIYVYPELLRQDLLLRKLIQIDVDPMHPSFSVRI